TRWPEGFKGTDIDPELTKGKMEKLIAKVEKLLPTEAAEPAKNLSPAELLARQWREALAANTMGAGAARPAASARPGPASVRCAPMPASRCRSVSTAPCASSWKCDGARPCARKRQHEGHQEHEG